MEIQITKLSKAYGQQEIFKDFSCVLAPGITCLMAPSGRGKTTLLRLLLGLEKPDGGSISLPAGVRFAAVFQEDRLLDFATAEGNVRFAAGANFEPRQCEKLLEELGLGACGKKIAGDFSGGMRRRLALARALCVPCDVLVLDEPFTGLDEENRRCAAVAVARHGAGKIVILVSHEAGDFPDATILRL